MNNPNIYFEEKFGIMWPWDMSHPQRPLILFNANFCLGFFGLNNIVNCLIANYSPHQTQLQPFYTNFNKQYFYQKNAIGVWSQTKDMKTRSKGSVCLLSFPFSLVPSMGAITLPLNYHKEKNQGFQLLFWLCFNYILKLKTSLPIVKCFFQLKMTFSIAYQNSWQCRIEPTTQSKPTYTCQFFNQHWSDKILVENDEPF